MEATGPNAAQIEFWNDDAGRRWVTQDAALARTLAPIGTAAVERARAVAGERILDVGCGAGRTSFELARRAGPSGSVLGVDISAPLLSLARELHAKERLENVSFVQADAQTHAFEPASFDLVFSRFGVMFFADPVAAFANLAAATREGGRLSFVCWQAMDRNAWVHRAVGAVLPHVPPPEPPPPGAPGPFAFADASRLRGILDGAGWRETSIDPFETPLHMGRDLEESVRLAAEVGPVARLLAAAEPSARDAALGSLRAALADAVTAEGVLLGGAMWFVSATR
jgi:SAM-dependent methyltransferase